MCNKEEVRSRGGVRGVEMGVEEVGAAGGSLGSPELSLKEAAARLQVSGWADVTMDTFTALTGSMVEPPSEHHSNRQ